MACTEEAMQEITEYIEVFYTGSADRQDWDIYPLLYYEQKFHAGQLAA